MSLIRCKPVSLVSLFFSHLSHPATSRSSKIHLSHSPAISYPPPTLPFSAISSMHLSPRFFALISLPSSFFCRCYRLSSLEKTILFFVCFHIRIILYRPITSDTFQSMKTGLLLTVLAVLASAQENVTGTAILLFLLSTKSLPCSLL